MSKYSYRSVLRPASQLPNRTTCGAERVAIGPREAFILYPKKPDWVIVYNQPLDEDVQKHLSLVSLSYSELENI